MASKDVRGFDHAGMISLLESVISHFPINIPSTQCKKPPIKDVQCAQNKTKEVKRVGSVKSVKCPFMSRNVSRNTIQKHNFR
jgi:hypothetical protein